MNKLVHLKDFERILADYHVSDESMRILADTKLVLLVAPTAGGRNTIIQELLKSGNYAFLVSDTTRQPRINNGVLEQNGIHYWFRSEEDIIADLKDGKFLEAEVIHRQQVSGVSIRELQKARDAGKIAITDIELGGIHKVAQAKPDTIAILVLPPSFEEWQRRIFSRGSMPEAEYKSRLETAARIFRSGMESDFLKIIVNDNLAHAARQVNELAISGKLGADEQVAGKQLVKKFLKETEAHLIKLS